LRGLGVAANATERAVRGTRKASWRDGIYRAAQRGDSTYVRAQVEEVAAELSKGNIRVEPGKATLVETRRHVESGWRSVARLLAKDSHRDLAYDVQRFLNRMPPVRTERELISNELHQRIRDSRVLDQHRTR
jgi:hypothetical protein